MTQVKVQKNEFTPKTIFVTIEENQVYIKHIKLDINNL
jgi:hypothetical protein